MNQALPLVSIVTPSYNKGPFIEETILSIKNQTYPHIEHIVMDGGSTDGTLDILRKYGDILTWISESDKGQSDAINKGWRIAKGEILAYLNADDTYMPWAVETAVKFLGDHPDVAMVYGQCNIIDERGVVLGRWGADSDLRELLRGPCMIPQQTVFFRRRVIDDVGNLDANLHMAMDYDLWIRICLKFRMKYIPRVLANIRLCPGTKSVDSGYDFGPDLIYVFDRLFSDPQLPKEIRALKRQAYSHAYMVFFLHCQREHRLKQAFRHLTKALMLYPCSLKNFGGLPLLIGFSIELLFGRKSLAIASKWKSRFSTKSHKEIT